MSSYERLESPESGDEQYRVTPLELFFDLVFVFALTQVTELVAEDLTVTGLLRGLAVLMVIWWAWVGFSWLTNAVPVEDDDRARLVVLVSMAAMLVMGLATPEAFGQDGVLFGSAYLAGTLLFLVLYVRVTQAESDMSTQFTRLAPAVLVAPVLILVAGFIDTGWVRALLWSTALLVIFVAPIVSGRSGWRVRPAHFAERHGLVVIIALGESLISLGLSASEREELSPAVISAASLGVLIIGCLWWLYFDVVSLVAERRLSELEGKSRNALARDSYSYLHLVMVGGIVMVALGLKEVLIYGTDSLDVVPAFTLFGGVAVYLLGHVLFRWRNLGSVNVQRLVTAIVLLALIPVATHIPAYASIVIVAGLVTILAAYESVRYKEQRYAIRNPD